eukprot:m.66580 g.66580  ORF g.66580 m.66580 type:complete len:171 (-) comp11817_c0_seq2:1575-2087(-)
MSVHVLWMLTIIRTIQEQLYKWNPHHVQRVVLILNPLSSMTFSLHIRKTGKWKLIPQSTKNHVSARSQQGTLVQIQSLTFDAPNLCVWHTPIPPPPPPPPPAPPKRPCLDGCVIVTSATIEMLNLNYPFSPSDIPSMDDPGRPSSDGLLHIHPSQVSIYLSQVASIVTTY